MLSLAASIVLGSGLRLDRIVDASSGKRAVTGFGVTSGCKQFTASAISCWVWQALDVNPAWLQFGEPFAERERPSAHPASY